MSNDQSSIIKMVYIKFSNSNCFTSNKEEHHCINKLKENEHSYVGSCAVRFPGGFLRIELMTKDLKIIHLIMLAQW